MNTGMSDISTTKMTSKGQVVIPEEIRDYMNLESGAKFIVLAMGDSIIFKQIMPMVPADIKKLLKASQALAKKHGLKEEDIPKMIAEVRKAKRKKLLLTSGKKTSK